MALPSATDVSYVGDNGPGGICIGYSSSKKVVLPVAAPPASTSITPIRALP